MRRSPGSEREPVAILPSSTGSIARSRGDPGPAAFAHRNQTHSHTDPYARTGHYQIFTRSLGSRHILSPDFTSNAFMKASLLVSGTKARAMPGEWGFVS